MADLIVPGRRQCEQLTVQGIWMEVNLFGVWDGGDGVWGAPQGAWSGQIVKFSNCQTIFVQYRSG